MCTLRAHTCRILDLGGITLDLRLKNLKIKNNGELPYNILQNSFSVHLSVYRPDFLSDCKIDEFVGDVVLLTIFAFSNSNFQGK